MAVDETGVDETAVDKTGVDELGINLYMHLFSSRKLFCDLLLLSMVVKGLMLMTVGIMNTDVFLTH